ncbi:MAG: hypothetical protein HZA54_15845, partial [Planctomycetes bacterium]|nr:hypothetical protein [Planctomycetota bacterium]
RLARLSFAADADAGAPAGPCFLAEIRRRPESATALTEHFARVLGLQARTLEAAVPGRAADWDEAVELRAPFLAAGSLFFARRGALLVVADRPERLARVAAELGDSPDSAAGPERAAGYLWWSADAAAVQALPTRPGALELTPHLAAALAAARSTCTRVVHADGPAAPRRSLTTYASEP